MLYLVLMFQCWRKYYPGHEILIAAKDWETQEPPQSHFCGYIELLLFRQQEDTVRSHSHVEKSK